MVRIRKPQIDKANPAAIAPLFAIHWLYPDKIKSSVFLMLCAVLVFPNPVSAKMHKCKNPDGSTTYSQTACTKEQESGKLRVVGAAGKKRGPGTKVCREVQTVAGKISGYMRQGVDSKDIFEALGGMYNLKSYAHSIIGYIYSFKHNKSISKSKIAGLSYKKCMAGGFNIKTARGRNGQQNEGRQSSGSGFAINENGIILTNAHVVQQCSTIAIRTDNGATAYAKLRDSDEQVDLAVLSSDLTLSPAIFRSSAIKLGETVAVVGYPLQGILAQQLNITGGNVSSLAGVSNNSQLVQITAPTQPGNSGGPLLDQSGFVGGVVSAKLNHSFTARTVGTQSENINFAVKGQAVKYYLNRIDLKYKESDKKSNLSMEALAEKARKFTVQITCNR